MDHRCDRHRTLLEEDALRGLVCPLCDAEYTDSFWGPAFYAYLRRLRWRLFRR